ncbi:hypothetical protein BB561_004505 [Smittium simulii]|uniref:SP-RING-type domain-containing protein n=1 Tax=Smittium simulii TaxID=133385 RepID=A0A2T9YFW7_9FUNG|nr:hypothetical protein BB561_004505 [Smittium simulii]
MVGKFRNEDDIISTGSTISLICPLSQSRITVPGKSKNCTHRQCFDLSVFLELNRDMPTWKCPVCINKVDSFGSLLIDEDFEIMLKKASLDSTQIFLDADGNFSLKPLDDTVSAFQHKPQSDINQPGNCEKKKKLVVFEILDSDSDEGESEQSTESKKLAEDLQNSNEDDKNPSDLDSNLNKPINDKSAQPNVENNESSGTDFNQDPNITLKLDQNKTSSINNDFSADVTDINNDKNTTRDNFSHNSPAEPNPSFKQHNSNSNLHISSLESILKENQYVNIDSVIDLTVESSDTETNAYNNAYDFSEIEDIDLENIAWDTIDGVFSNNLGNFNEKNSEFPEISKSRVELNSKVLDNGILPDINLAVKEPLPSFSSLFGYNTVSGNNTEQIANIRKQEDQNRSNNLHNYYNTVKATDLNENQRHEINIANPERLYTNLAHNPDISNLNTTNQIGNSISNNSMGTLYTQPQKKNYDSEEDIFVNIDDDFLDEIDQIEREYISNSQSLSQNRNQYLT